MNKFIASVFAPAIRYLKISHPVETECDRLVRQRRETSEKLTLSKADRELINRLDELIEMHYQISK